MRRAFWGTPPECVHTPTVVFRSCLPAALDMLFLRAQLYAMVGRRADAERMITRYRQQSTSEDIGVRDASVGMTYDVPPRSSRQCPQVHQPLDRRGLGAHMRSGSDPVRAGLCFSATRSPLQAIPRPDRVGAIPHCRAVKAGWAGNQGPTLPNWLLQQFGKLDSYVFHLGPQRRLRISPQGEIMLICADATARNLGCRLCSGLQLAQQAQYVCWDTARHLVGDLGPDGGSAHEVISTRERPRR